MDEVVRRDLARAMQSTMEVLRSMVMLPHDEVLAVLRSMNLDNITTDDREHMAQIAMQFVEVLQRGIPGAVAPPALAAGSAMALSGPGEHTTASGASSAADAGAAARARGAGFEGAGGGFAQVTAFVAPPAPQPAPGPSMTRSAVV